MPDPVRPLDDHYRSTPCTFRALASVESFPGGLHEFCAGDGILAATAADIVGPENVVATTIGDVSGQKTYFPVTGNRDFLKQRELIRPNLFSNPPYGRLYGQRIGKARAATAIIRHGIELLTEAGPRGGKLCCLLDLRYLLSEDRNLDDGLFINYPPARVHAFIDRITMYPAAFEGTTTRGKQSFAWFVWEWPFLRPGHVPPITSRLHGKAFIHPTDKERFDLSDIVSGKQEIAEAAE
ncbi:hypothetical protein ABIE64_002225 [Thalassospira sp. MBR-102]|jgi:hypothetical protein|uniref:hypothetical protein n=1 Tax=Thalassospira sp. MBR-102 TaxID=3156466 RepID=UPI003397AA1A